MSIARVEALERALEAQKQHSSLAREKIYDRLGELERGMATVTTQYGNIIDRLSSMSADLNALKENLRRKTRYALERSLDCAPKGPYHWSA